MREPLRVTVSGGEYDDVLRRLTEEKFASRLAATDATLWGDEAEAEASIRLNWVGLHESSRPLLAEIDALRADLWGEGLDRVVLCGMGGSSLAPEVITRTFDADLVVLDSTAPSAVARATGTDLERTVVVVSSKSGGTVETDSQRRAFVEAFTAAGIDAASRIVAITDPGSPLSELAAKAGYRKVFHADPNVGGRYSALTAFGLVPSGLAGVDVSDLLDEADEVAPELFTDSPDNPALRLGAWLAASPGRDKAVLTDAGSGIAGFPDWAEQLISESTGKHGTGVLPAAVESPVAPELGHPADDVILGLLVHAEGPEAPAPPAPTARVSGPLGAQFLLWEVATAVAGRLLGINPFDQPDVESAKAATRALLDERPESDPPAFVDGPVEVRGSADLLGGARTVGAAVDALLARLGDDGYLAVMAYLDSGRYQALVDVRAALARRTSRPVTFGWGPRFLHSTGQYHKGGPPTGVFLQITGDPGDDVAIPGRPFGFATLLAAQAAGDATVLTGLGRPVLRLHLTDVDAGSSALRDAVR
ncbi:MAG: glucose-6-phosphate isomerase [Propionibacteriales bacterium]|nr:glucose-6-phosphate isomerase [Propionibacteriales bacterium]